MPDKVTNNFHDNRTVNATARSHISLTCEGNGGKAKMVGTRNNFSHKRPTIQASIGFIISTCQNHASPTSASNVAQSGISIIVTTQPLACRRDNQHSNF
jgi:hypothetical protein